MKNTNVFIQDSQTQTTITTLSSKHIISANQMKKEGEKQREKKKKKMKREGIKQLTH